MLVVSEEFDGMKLSINRHRYKFLIIVICVYICVICVYLIYIHICEIFIERVNKDIQYFLCWSLHEVIQVHQHFPATHFNGFFGHIGDRGGALSCSRRTPYCRLDLFS